MNNNVPMSSLYTLADDAGIPHTEVDEWIEQRNKGKAVKNAVDTRNEDMYLNLDTMILDVHRGLVIFKRDTYTDFYEYHDGVYSLIDTTSMEHLVDRFMFENGLLQHRASRRKVADTVARIESSLARNNKVITQDKVIHQPWKINLRNGLLDPLTETLSEHTPDYFSTNQIPFDYDPSKKIDRFAEFLQDVAHGDPDQSKMLQEVFGYCLLNGNPLHKIFFFYGNSGRNGKSTTSKIISGLIGEDNVSSLSLDQVNASNSSILTNIIGKQINISDEGNSKYIDSQTLSSIASEGAVTIDPKYRSSFTYKITAKFIVNCNNIPRSKDDIGLRGRMMIVPFKTKFTNDGDKKPIPNYDAILLNEEGSAILNWALEGTRKVLQDKSFTVSDLSTEDLEDYKMESNSVYAFLRSCFTFSETHEIPLTSEQLYGRQREDKDRPATMYIKFCHDTNVKPLSLQNFRSTMKGIVEKGDAQFPGLREERATNTATGKPGARVYVGIMDSSLVDDANYTDFQD